MSRKVSKVSFLPIEREVSEVYPSLTGRAQYNVSSHMRRDSDYRHGCVVS